jgi:hypothetical protein
MEHERHGHRTTMDDPLEEETDSTVSREEANAAAEAGEIGGPTPDEPGDEAMRPVYEAGGGEEEGFELAEADLVENATHGDPGVSPEADAFTPEEESDESTAVYGEGDEVDPTEVRRDPREGPDDPGLGTDIAPDR